MSIREIDWDEFDQWCEFARAVFASHPEIPPMPVEAFILNPSAVTMLALHLAAGVRNDGKTPEEAFTAILATMDSLKPTLFATPWIALVK